MGMFSKKVVSFASSLVFLGAFTQTAFATNGSFLIGYGAKSRGMGGAGVAYAQDSLVSATNPAGMSDVGIRFDGGLMIFNPERSAWVPGFSGKSEIDSGATIYAIPNIGFNYPFNRKLTVGFAFVGAGGGGTRYNENFFDFGNPANLGPTLGVNLAQAIMSPSFAYNVTKKQSIGASLLLGIQTFRAFGLDAFGDAGFSIDPDNLTSRGNDWSYGAGVRFGWRGKFYDDKLTLGAVYSSRMYMTKFDKYKGLFAEQGDADIPEQYAIGLAFKATDKATVAFDIQRINYGDIASFSNPGPIRFLPLPTAADERLMGMNNGLGFGWQDMTIYKLGLNYDYNDKYSFRAGWNYGKKPMCDGGTYNNIDGITSPVDKCSVDILANTLAPAVVEHHLTLGMSYRPSKKVEWTVGLMHAFREDVVKFNDFSGDNIKISMNQWAGDLSFGYNF